MQSKLTSTIIYKFNDTQTKLLSFRILNHSSFLVYQNWFKFDCNLSEAEGIYNKNPKSSDEKKLLACMALSFLLEGDTSSEKYGRAEEYEKHLLETTSRKEKYSMSRRKTYELEIGIIRDPEEALEKINIEENPTLDISNSYYLAAVLKCIALNDFSSRKNQEQLYAVKKLLDSLDLDYLVAKNLGHPHQRIAYWYIRAHLQIWPEIYKTEKINKCIDYLIDKLHKKEWFNSLGVILVCELLDLIHRLDKDIISNNVELQQIQGCDLIKNEITIYKQKTTTNKSKTSFAVLKTIIEDDLERVKSERNEGDHKAWIKGLGGPAGVPMMPGAGEGKGKGKEN